MKPLSKKQIKVLEDNEWFIVCESPFEMEFNSQFCGQYTCKSLEEAHQIYKETVESAENMRKFKKWQKESRENEYKTKSDALLKRLDESVRQLKKKVTAMGLLEFLNAGKDSFDFHGDTFIAEHYIEFFEKAIKK
jgi:hypothetical protein